MNQVNKDDGPIDFGKLADHKQTRVKVVVVQAPLLRFFLTLTGEFVLRCEGFPEDAELVSMGVRQGENGIPQVEMLLYHPTFPIVVGRMPPVISVVINGTPLVEAQAEAVASQAEEAASE